MTIYLNKYYEKFDNYDIVIVVSRYAEDLNWIHEEPFNNYPYYVYNKGDDSNYAHTNKFLIEIKKKNVGREVHSYFDYIITNYDNLNDITIFVPGSLDLKHKYYRAKELFGKIEKTKKGSYFSCIKMENTVYLTEKNFSIDNYLSSNSNNKTLNTDSSMELSSVRPFGEWYDTTFGNMNKETNCFTQNAIFAISKETIRSKPKIYYENLINQVNNHHNHETVHYFERSWQTVFYPYKDGLTEIY